MRAGSGYVPISDAQPPNFSLLFYTLARQ